MRVAAQDSGEWIDGFLFVANMLILDLLNTQPVLGDGPKELLPDAHAFERWLIASGMVSSPKTKTLLRSWRNSAEAASFLKELIGFRERLREAILRVESGSVPSDDFLKEINAGLQRYSLQSALRKRDGKVVREIFFEPHEPADFWRLILDATADLFLRKDLSRVRKCESCVVHFLDTSKKGSRRWCSMNICGNKFKVAAYQRRKRDQTSNVD